MAVFIAYYLKIACEFFKCVLRGEYAKEQYNYRYDCRVAI